MTRARPFPDPNRSLVEYALDQAQHRDSGRHRLDDPPPPSRLWLKVATGVVAAGAVAAAGHGAVAAAAVGEGSAPEPTNPQAGWWNQLVPALSGATTAAAPAGTWWDHFIPTVPAVAPAAAPAPAPVAAPAPAPVVTTAAAPVSSDRLLVGSTGVAVEELQRVLNAWYPELAPIAQDGVFGPETAERVRHLQTACAIDIDGIVGPQTRGVLHLPEPDLIDRVGASAPAAEQAAPPAAEAVSAATGDVVRPTVGRLTSTFGARWGTTHYGIDIANRIGTPIHATTDGVIIESGPASGFGLWIRLKHDDGTISVYGHINESLVSEGQRVGAGEQIATIGNRGQSTGPHLHFEIWTPGGKKINPLIWLREHGVSLGSD